MKKKIVSIITLLIVLLVSVFGLVGCDIGNKNSGNTGASSVGLKYTLINDDTEYSVTGIGVCTDTDIVIPSTYKGKPVTCIGKNAFHACTSLTSITIGTGVTSIGEGAFGYCSSLKNIEVADGNPNYKSIDGNLYSKEGVLIQYATAKTETSFVIPNGVNSIGKYVFHDSRSLETITIPDSVTNIDENAFIGCPSLKTVIIGEGVISIGSCAFSECDLLTTVIIDSSYVANNLIAVKYATDVYIRADITITSSVYNTNYNNLGIEEIGGLEYYHYQIKD